MSRKKKDLWISKKTLKMLDSSMKNFAKGIAGEPLDMKEMRKTAKRLDKNFMEGIKNLIDLGVSLDIPFKDTAEGYFSDFGVRLFLGGKSHILYSVWGSHYKIDYKFKSFKNAYHVFKQFLDPKINPGIAFERAQEILLKEKPDICSDDDKLVIETRKIIKRNHWALKFNPKSIKRGKNES
jgi:hypothetical protein